MEKYATYYIYKNIETGELKRIPHGTNHEMIKTADVEKWKQLEEEPEIEKSN